RIGGISYFIPQENNIKVISKKLMAHLGVPPKSVRQD
ncbi:LytR family transcriptional regulator, partial [Bacillus thuringiensis]|nr:LytR family transcriptional regulator [Bacillus thuringiensis]